MENIFLNLGLSYTLSKLLPFILMTLLGIIIGVYIFKKSTKLITKIAGILAIFIPFSIYFAINPIYQGDFTNEARVVSMHEKVIELKDKKFVLVAMPGCPYCLQAIGFLKEFQKRNPKVTVEFLVTSSNPETLEPYAKEIDGAFKISLTEKPEEIGNLVEGHFPSYILVQGDEISVWTNNNFGVRAFDKIVNSFK